MDNLALYKRIIIQSLPNYMLFFYTVQTEKKNNGKTLLNGMHGTCR